MKFCKFVGNLYHIYRPINVPLFGNNAIFRHRVSPLAQFYLSLIVMRQFMLYQLALKHVSKTLIVK